MSEDDLRDKLTKAIEGAHDPALRNVYAGRYVRLADALMPVVREALADAKSDEYHRAYRIGYDDGRRRYGWISDAASAAAFDPDGYYEWAQRSDHLRNPRPEDKREERP